MIPDFDENGYLPPGIWPTTIEEVGRRFANGQHRQRIFQGFVKVVEVLEVLRDANCLEVHLNGSFICNVDEPRDYDMCYEWRGMVPTNEWRELLAIPTDERKHKYFGDISIRMPVPPFLEDYVEFWQTDRDNNLKGILRIEL